MDSTTHSTPGPAQPPAPPDELAGLASLAAAANELAAQDLDRLPDAALAEQVLGCGGCWTAWKANGSRN